MKVKMELIFYFCSMRATLSSLSEAYVESEEITLGPLPPFHLHLPPPPLLSARLLWSDEWPRLDEMKAEEDECSFHYWKCTPGLHLSRVGLWVCDKWV